MEGKNKNKLIDKRVSHHTTSKWTPMIRSKVLKTYSVFNCGVWLTRVSIKS